MMTPTPPRQTAQILAFPLRERVLAMASREQKFAAMESAARRYASSVPGGAWYHDEAVEDDATRN